MDKTINNIYCVGRNYGRHAAELGNHVPDSPMIFMKPTHAITSLQDTLLRLPSALGDVHYETELVVRVGKPYTRGALAEHLISDFALGLDLTLRDVQSELKEKQHPWLKAKGFLHSAPITGLRPADRMEVLVETPFSLLINGEERQRGSLSEAIFGLQILVDHIGGHYGLGEGDLIFTGTPEGVGKLRDGDILELLWDGQQEGKCRVSMHEGEVES
ncbi:fumarylacetoacetate hydrolase family protein [Paenibacillus sp. 1P07SE]|uniref:fumarylacetoacetate hydrolase family protein n=1 Tax=Paenibacillus sp. 1P07SE TaxID=3132209 RepID=UPI0039A57D8C